MLIIKIDSPNALFHVTSTIISTSMNTPTLRMPLIRLVGKVLRYHQMAPLHTPSPLPTIHDHVWGQILKIKFGGLTTK